MQSEIELKPCPFCGDGKVYMKEMDASIQHQMYAICGNCESTGPVRVIARAAAKAWNRRAEPENRVLTLEEVKRHCEVGVEAAPLWVEFKDKPRLSRWCVADEPEELFNTKSIVDHIQKAHWLYNIRWRCWLRKPTEGKAAGTPWEE